MDDKGNERPQKNDYCTPLESVASHPVDYGFRNQQQFRELYKTENIIGFQLIPMSCQGISIRVMVPIVENQAVIDDHQHITLTLQNIITNAFSTDRHLFEEDNFLDPQTNLFVYLSNYQTSPDEGFSRAINNDGYNKSLSVCGYFGTINPSTFAHELAHLLTLHGYVGGVFAELLASFYADQWTQNMAPEELGPNSAYCPINQPESITPETDKAMVTLGGIFNQVNQIAISHPELVPITPTEMLWVTGTQDQPDAPILHDYLLHYFLPELVETLKSKFPQSGKLHQIIRDLAISRSELYTAGGLSQEFTDYLFSHRPKDLTTHFSNPSHDTDTDMRQVFTFISRLKSVSGLPETEILQILKTTSLNILTRYSQPVSLDT